MDEIEIVRSFGASISIGEKCRAAQQILKASISDQVISDITQSIPYTLQHSGPIKKKLKYKVVLDIWKLVSILQEVEEQK